MLKIAKIKYKPARYNPMNCPPIVDIVMFILFKPLPYTSGFLYVLLLLLMLSANCPIFSWQPIFPKSFGIFTQGKNKRC